MITASIVTFHTKHRDLIRLIQCVMKSPIEIIYVIDNSTNDELRDFVKDNDRIRYIHSLNLGYGSGHNVAIQRAIEDGAKYHAILNPDVYWNDNVVEELSEYLDNHAECGLVMPKVLYPNGDIQYLCKLVPTPMDLFLRRFIPIKSWQKKHDYNYEMHWTGYNKIMEIPILSGCFMMLRCDIIQQTGGFDERYFMYAEDVDLCRRIGDVSTTIFYPHVSIFHEYAKGSYGNKKMLKMHIKSITKYFCKWGWFLDKKRRERNKKCIDKIKHQLSNSYD
ncbi:MAG: glycosyltransferase family 2 protein [Muribaculaceae bacterium]|nr:glycosyltransferase family 2 protein [Muribaculaceae bacterium]